MNEASEWASKQASERANEQRMMSALLKQLSKHQAGWLRYPAFSSTTCPTAVFDAGTW